MKLDFNLQIKQKQGLALTAQVQQAIKLLHMTNMEIQEFVSDQFQDNPFIEANTLSQTLQPIKRALRKIKKIWINRFKKIHTRSKIPKVR